MAFRKDRPELSTPRSPAAVAGVIVLAGLALRTILPLNPDLSWLANLAASHLRGIEVYQRFVELNPPLAWWVQLPAAAVSGTTGISLSATVHIATICLVLALGAAAVALTPRPYRTRALPWLAFAALVLPGVQFGQRDHLVALLFLPAAIGLVIAGEAEPLPAWQDVTLGALLGLACSFKPHYLPAALFLVGLRTKSSGRPGSGWNPSALLAMVLVGAFLGAASLVLEPDYLKVVNDYGTLYAAWHGAALLDYLKPVALVPVAGALALMGSRGGGRATILLTLLVAGVALQNKGFAYHFLPSAAVTIVLVPLVLGPGRPWRVVPLALVAVVATWSLAVEGERLVHNRRVSAEQALRTIPAGSSVLVLTHVVGSSWPSVIDNGWTWTSSFASSWWLETIIANHGGKWCAEGQVRRDDLTADERRALDRAITDFLFGKPEVILTYKPVRAPDGACITRKQWYQRDDTVRRYQVGALDVLATDRCVAMLLRGYAESTDPGRTWQVLLHRRVLMNLPPECDSRR